MNAVSLRLWTSDSILGYQNERNTFQLIESVIFHNSGAIWSTFLILYLPSLSSSMDHQRERWQRKSLRLRHWDCESTSYCADQTRYNKVVSCLDYSGSACDFTQRFDLENYTHAFWYPFLNNHGIE